MTTYYVDPAAAGANDGTSWTDAWTTIQTAFDTAVAGDVVYCRGTQTFGSATPLDIDTNSGTNAAGHIKFIGCNASGNRDGSRFVVDANSQACGGIHINGSSLVWLENIEVKNCGGSSKDGFYADTGQGLGCVFINCSSHNNSGAGFNLRWLGPLLMIRCTSHINAGAGFSFYFAGVKCLFCVAHDNTTDGFVADNPTIPTAKVYLGCLSYDNGDDGIGGFGPDDLSFNCAFDGNADDGVELIANTALSGALVAATRITNHSGAGDIGLNANSKPCLTLACYFEDNDGDNIQNATLHSNISIDGTTASSNVEDQADTNEGYTDKTDGAQDFNLRSDASLRRTAITIPTS